MKDLKQIKYFLYGAAFATGIIFTANYVQGQDYTCLLKKDSSKINVLINNLHFETFPSELTFNKFLQKKS